MPKSTRKPSPAPTWSAVLTDPGTLADVAKALFCLAVLALLGWIGFNVHLIRKAVTAERALPAPVVPTVEEESPATRLSRIAAALPTRLPRGIRVNETVLNEIAQGGPNAEEQLARVAVEIALRRNGCHPRTEAADGRLSTAEQRAIRTCTALQEERLMRNATEPGTARAIAWVEGVVGE